MIKFSAGYNKINPNFVIQNIEKESNPSPVLAVMQNILTRGCPTIPSRELRKQFGKVSTNENEDFVYHLSFGSLNWDKTIKGGSNFNPARDFYKNGFKKIFGIDSNYSGSFIPECAIEDIIYDFHGKKGIDSHVDFYSPFYKTVVEIDGSQHNSDPQSEKDKARDVILRGKGIHIYRIESNWQDRNYVSTLPSDSNMFSLIDTENRNFSYSESSYLYAIRLQLLLANLYANNVIKTSDRLINLYLHTDVTTTEKTILTITTDFFDMLTALYSLQNIDFKKPYVNIVFCRNEDELSKNDDGINVDISLLQTYCDTKYKNIYYIRNDYFLYEDKKYFTNESDSTFWYKKNNYQITFADIKYKVDIEKHKDALLYLLRNTSSVYYDFREKQLEIIVALLNERGVIGVLPTSAGKSLCYQLCAMLIPSMTLVVAPLQLLMADQARNVAKYFGITNVAVVNAMTKYEQSIFENMQALITTIAPERFFSRTFTDAIISFKNSKGVNSSAFNPIGFIVIDEVHCLSEWGHDFRTSYLCLSHHLSNYFPETTYLMALTGTASRRVYEDVEHELENFKNHKIYSVFAENMRRDNLNIEVLKVNDYYPNLVNILKPIIDGTSDDKTLIFTKQKTYGDNASVECSACIPLKNHLAQDFNEQNLNDKMSYYAGGDTLDDEEKLEVLNDFSTGNKKIVLATKAFGMGVDIPDIRMTIHYGLPSSMESLYQEMGRAGRDGKQSRCIVMYKAESQNTIDRFFRRPLMPMSEMSDTNGYLNELSTNFYFMSNQNLDPDVEYALIKLVLDMIRKQNLGDPDYKTLSVEKFKDEILKSGASGSAVRYAGVKDDGSVDRVRNLVEKSLYRLFLLGEINMWSMVYGPDVNNPTYISLKLTSLTDEEKLERLKEYITKYQNYFDFTLENTFNNRLKYLINWTNENYVTERVQAIKTLYYECLNFTSSDAFMSFISNYFSNDSIFTRLTDPSLNDVDAWIDAIKEPERAKDCIARLLESYDRMVGLNYVSGITRLRLNEFDDPDGRYRLMDALNHLKEVTNEKQRQRLFIRTYNVIENEYHDEFVECWLQELPEDVKYICVETNNEVAEQFIITAFVKDLLELGGEFNGKL